MTDYFRYLAELITDTVQAIYAFINITLRILYNFSQFYGLVIRTVLIILGFDSSKMD